MTLRISGGVKKKKNIEMSKTIINNYRGNSASNKEYIYYFVRDTEEIIKYCWEKQPIAIVELRHVTPNSYTYIN